MPLDSTNRNPAPATSSRCATCRAHQCCGHARQDYRPAPPAVAVVCSPDSAAPPAETPAGPLDHAAPACGTTRADADARDLLAPIYGWFMEGFDAPDLKDTKALLDELTGAAT